MSSVKLPEIVNISKAGETKSKNFIIHLSNSQWKNTVSKSVVYKGKKKFTEVAKEIFSFNEIDGLDGGLLTAYSMESNGKKKILYPVVEINGGKKIIVFKPKRPGGGGSASSCSRKIVNGYMQCSGSCDERRSCLSIISGDSVTCMCLKPATY